MNRSIGETGIRPDYVRQSRERQMVTILTDNPSYLPASAAQIEDLRGLILKVAGSSAYGYGESRARDFESKAERFETLLSQWRVDTQFATSALEIAMHPGYQQIIGIGQAAIPYILRELAEHGEHWFWALRAITGENPVDERNRGDVEKMRLAWLQWGVRNGYDYRRRTDRPVSRTGADAILCDKSS